MTRSNRLVAGIAALMFALAAIHLAAQSGHDLFQKALAAERADGNLREAIALYERVVQQSARDRRLTARALLRLAECQEKLGLRDAASVYERIVREFGDQAESAAAARTRLAAIQAPATHRETARQVATVRGTDYPRLSLPDGRYLSFRTTGVGELMVRDLVTGTERRLTRGQTGAYAGASAVSPNGREIAYAWSGDAVDGVEIRVLPLNATETTPPRVARRGDPNDAQIEPFAWTPDGRQLVVVRTLKDRTKQWATVAMRDGSLRVLKSVGWRYPVGSLSPDGRYLAYELERGDGVQARDLFLLSLDGSRETELVRHPADDLRPVWLPDGTQVLFLSDRTGSRSLWRVPVEAGKPAGAPQLVKPDFGPGLLLGMTRNGALHSFVWGGGRNVYTAALAPDATLATPPVLATERYVNANGTPSWSPDGRTLAYYVFRPQGTTSLVVRTVRTGEERELPLNLPVSAPFGDAPRWFPDGQSLLIVASNQARQGSVGYYRVDVNRGTTELLHRPKAWGPPAFQPAVSADGRSIFYLDYDSEPPTNLLVRVALGGRDEVTVARPDAGHFFAAFALAPDGLHAAVLTRNPQQGPSVLSVMSVTGETSREVLRGAPLGPETQVAWTPDQRFLLVTAQDSGQKGMRLLRVPVAGGPPEPMGLAADRIRSVSVHADGRRIAFEAAESRGSEVWALENFLPPRVGRQESAVAGERR